MPGILKRQKFKWTSLPVIRRPESLWKMSYGYFWRTKCSVSPQGKPWIARVGITWKEGLADVLGTCHWRSVFCSQCHRSPSEETVQKDSCICESFCEKLTDACYRGEKDGVRKLILQYLMYSYLIYCLDFGKPALQHTLGASFSPQMSSSWMAVGKRVVTVANLCWGLGVHKVWRMGDYAHVDVPLLHLTETTSFWCHPSVRVGVGEVHIVSHQKRHSCTHRRSQSKQLWDQVSDIINLMLPSRGAVVLCVKRVYGNSVQDNLIQGMWWTC